MKSNYEKRFGTLASQDALCRIIEAMEYEAEAVKYVRERDKLHRSASEVARWRSESYHISARMMVKEANVALNPRYLSHLLNLISPISRFGVSARKEIENALEAIAEETGKDYTWLKELIGHSPRSYFQLESENMPEERRTFLLKLLLRSEGEDASDLEKGLSLWIIFI